LEASALHAPSGLGRITAHGRLLRLRSDDQLVALFRMGYDDAFGTIHDRYRQRLLAYTRQMLGPSRSDAEDVLQDVFLRAYGALRNDDRPVTLRAWLYRVAHNRCIDHLRRPVPPPAEIYELSRTPTHDPQAETVRREDLRRLVQDVQRLPEQQRSALLMRELDGLSYAELADALDTSVPAIKSLLVRARVGLVEAEEARDAACVDIRADLFRSHGRGVRTSGRSRRHLRDCDACREYRQGLRGVDAGLAALVPGGAGPLAAVAKLLGIGGAASGAAAGAGAGASGTAAVAGGATAATATATKVVAIVCCAAVVGGGAAEVRQQVATPVTPSKHAVRHVRKATPRATPIAPIKAPVARAMNPVRDAGLAAPSAHKASRHRAAASTPAITTEPMTGSVAAPAPAAPITAAPEEAQTGGAMAPDEDAMPDPSGTGAVGAPSPDDPGAAPGPTTPPTATPATGQGANAGAAGDAGAPIAGATAATPPSG
jgi:RNA polymerase sigma factor (sigma-70 family)